MRLTRFCCPRESRPKRASMGSATPKTSISSGRRDSGAGGRDRVEVRAHARPPRQAFEVVGVEHPPDAVAMDGPVEAGDRAGQHPGERGLAHPRRAEEGVEPGAFDAQAEVVEDLPFGVRVAVGDVVRLEAHLRSGHSSAGRVMFPPGRERGWTSIANRAAGSQGIPAPCQQRRQDLCESHPPPAGLLGIAEDDHGLSTRQPEAALHRVSDPPGHAVAGRHGHRRLLLCPRHAARPVARGLHPQAAARRPRDGHAPRPHQGRHPPGPRGRGSELFGCLPPVGAGAPVPPRGHPGCAADLGLRPRERAAGCAPRP